MSIFDDFEEDGSDDECPSCGTFPDIDGVTEGCYDAAGCGMYVRDSLDEETSEEIMDVDYDEEDEDLQELDFD